MYECKACNRNFGDNSALVKHTESVHGRAGVYRGVAAWEKSRNQRGYITTGVAEVEYTYSVDQSQYNNYTDRWECGMCNRTFAHESDLLKHMNSGKHEHKRYNCEECKRKFSALAALNDHLSMTGHSSRESRLVDVMINDAQYTQRLLLTNGSADDIYYECILYFDGSCRRNPCSRGGCGWVLEDHRGRIMEEGGRSVYELNSSDKVTNNLAEYSGLVHGLLAAESQGVKRLLVRGDSELVINHLNRVYKKERDHLYPLYLQAMELKDKSFQKCKFEWIAREDNTRADSLARHYAG